MLQRWRMQNMPEKNTSRPNAIVGIRTQPREADDGAIEWHIVGLASTDYSTACGIDGNDPVVNQFGLVDAPRGARVTCRECFLLWTGFRALPLRASSFAEVAKR